MFCHLSVFQCYYLAAEFILSHLISVKVSKKCVPLFCELICSGASCGLDLFSLKSSSEILSVWGGRYVLLDFFVSVWKQNGPLNQEKQNDVNSEISAIQKGQKGPNSQFKKLC